jgi:hypothetical protein
MLTIDLKQIEQGVLGDCYFVSALIVLSQRPEVVSELIVQPADNAAGASCVSFWRMNKRRPIVVDTRVQFKNGM